MAHASSSAPPPSFPSELVSLPVLNIPSCQVRPLFPPQMPEALSLVYLPAGSLAPGRQGQCASLHAGWLARGARQAHVGWPRLTQALSGCQALAPLESPRILATVLQRGVVAEETGPEREQLVQGHRASEGQSGPGHLVRLASAQDHPQQSAPELGTRSPWHSALQLRPPLGQVLCPWVAYGGFIISWRHLAQFPKGQVEGAE